MTPLLSVPGGAPPGVSPQTLVLSSLALAASIGMSSAAAERLVKRHRRELRTYGPIIKGQLPGEFYLTGDQCDLVRLLSETAHGATERATLMTGATMVLCGLSPLDPSLPDFKTPDEVRRFIVRGRQ